MDIQGLQKIVQTGLFSLANSLTSYWPAYGSDDITERNLSAHVGSAFLKNGFDVYFEVPISKEDKTNKIDCVFLSYEHKLVIVCESKRLIGVDKAQGIIDDIERIHKFKLIDQGIDIKSYYGLILAYTWKEDITKWWISEENTDEFEEKDPRWRELSKRLKNVESDAITLYHEPKHDVVKALYAIWQFPKFPK